MEKQIVLNANAKVNLTLDVLYKRSDGYHELEGVMHEISLSDRVSISLSDRISVRFDADIPENNTCKKACELFLKGRSGASVFVNKRIPSEAGLGGASADAAAVLRGLNRLYENTPLHLSEAELFDLGLRVGADVPFCLMGGCAVARGVGERLEPLEGIPLELLIVRGPRGVSTGRLFSSLGVGSESMSRLPERNLYKTLEAIRKKDARALGANLANALTEPACALAPEIREYIDRMLSLGALGASMTGSGAAVFGIFEKRDEAEKALLSFGSVPFKTVCQTVI